MRWMVVAALVAGCAAREVAVEPAERFDGEFAAAHGKRRVVALVSPS